MSGFWWRCCGGVAWRCISSCCFCCYLLRLSLSIFVFVVVVHGAAANARLVVSSIWFRRPGRTDIDEVTPAAAIIVCMNVARSMSLPTWNTTVVIHYFKTRGMETTSGQTRRFVIIAAGDVRARDETMRSRRNRRRYNNSSGKTWEIEETGTAVEVRLPIRVGPVLQFQTDTTRISTSSFHPSARLASEYAIQTIESPGLVFLRILLAPCNEA